MSAQDYIIGYPFAGVTRNPFNYVKVEQLTRDVTTAWLTLDEITQQINLYQDESQDGYLQSLEVAVRQAVEDYLGLSIFPVTYRVYYGTESMTATPCALDLPEISQAPNGPGITIQSVKYYNNNTPSTVTTIAASQYQYDPSGNRVLLQSLPSNINSNMTAPIMVEYQTAGSPLQAYPVIKQAGLLLFTHLYNNRSNSTTANSLRDIPFGFVQLLRPYKPLVM